MSSKGKPVHMSARRKTSSVRVTVMDGKGRVRINNTPLELFEPGTARDKMLEPLILSGDLRNKVDVSVETSGGGVMGQAAAARMAIASALVSYSKSKSLRSAFMSYDRSMLAGDPRQKEPKKFGGPGARRRKQKSYR
jgi:small subunit ribosomal protein S9